MHGVRVAVAGAGLAGLTAARRLADAGADVTIYEREPTVGGRVRTSRQNGFLLDRGFQVLFTAYPAVQRELDLDALTLREFSPGAVIARPGHRATLSDPLRDPRALLESALMRDITLGDKLRTLRLKSRLGSHSLADLFTGPDTTIREYLTKAGFSEKFIANFAAPFYGGITLDRSLTTSKQIFEYTFATLARGAIAVPKNGMQAIPEQLATAAKAAGAAVETNTAVESIQSTDAGVTITTNQGEATADIGIVAMGLQSGELTGLDALPMETNGCVTQYYTLPDRHTLGLGNRLILNAAGQNPNHVVPHSAIAPEHAPAETPLLSATFLGEPTHDAATLAAETREALASWFPERQFHALEILETIRIPNAQFAQPPGFRAQLPNVREPDGPVYLAGDLTEWSSIQGALESGATAADAIETDVDSDR